MSPTMYTMCLNWDVAEIRVGYLPSTYQTNVGYVEIFRAGRMTARAAGPARYLYSYEYR